QTAKDSGATAEGALRSVTQSTGGLGDSLQSDIEQGRTLNAELKKTAGNMSALTGLRRTGGALTQPWPCEGGRPVQLIGDLGQVGKELESLTQIALPTKEAIVGLVTTMGPWAIALGAGAAAIALWQSKLNEGKGITDQAITQLDAYYAAIQAGSDSLQ